MNNKHKKPPLNIPENLPDLTGYYYHFKHDPAQGINHYAYEFVGYQYNTSTGQIDVSYRPLYPCELNINGREFMHFCFSRPLHEWIDEVTRDGRTCCRFTEITDMDVVIELFKIRKTLYPKEPGKMPDPTHHTHPEHSPDKKKVAKKMVAKKKL